MLEHLVHLLGRHLWQAGLDVPLMGDIGHICVRETKRSRVTQIARTEVGKERKGKGEGEGEGSHLPSSSAHHRRMQESSESRRNGLTSLPRHQPFPHLKPDHSSDVDELPALPPQSQFIPLRHPPLAHANDVDQPLLIEEVRQFRAKREEGVDGVSVGLQGREDGGIDGVG